MSRRETLAELTHFSQSVEAEFVKELTDAERSAIGSDDSWTAKDLVAHVTAWRRRGVALLEGARRGEIPNEIAEFDEVNRRLYFEHRDLTWPDVLQQSAATWDSFRSALEQAPEALLEASEPSEVGTEPPLWRRLTIDAANHPVMHFAGHAARKGRGAAALRWMEALTPRLLQLDPSDEWRGVVHYNLGCSRALAGERQSALDALRIGLSLRPALKAWAPNDTDLASLHQDPDFIQITRP